MQRLSLYFTAPSQVEVRSEPLPAGKPDQVLVAARFSAISAGTEMLIYRGQAPEDMAADATIDDLTGSLAFPLKYGYSLAGQVIDVADKGSRAWIGRWVFAFHPHESHFWVNPASLHPLPPDLPPEDALFLPNMETAVNFLQDAEPLIGEQVVVFGQGVVGLLTTGLLARTPLAQLLTLDRYPLRREMSLAWGADASLDPTEPDILARLQEALRDHDPAGRADLSMELSGAPDALQQAIDITGFAGRILIGSWYGRKPMRLNLGSDFHRNRIRLISSQVSTLAPRLRGRWSKARRLRIAWDWLARLHPAELITHRVAFDQAPQAYALLHTQPQEHLQIILQYPTKD
ncbi:MAG TPA: zinc-binding alcohol dehydrogenase [Caldilineae bacterium]|nr:zinc-binding alcohol dehydrogenase [Caldilineae bacterium]